MMNIITNVIFQKANFNDLFCSNFQLRLSTSTLPQIMYIVIISGMSFKNTLEIFPNSRFKMMLKNTRAAFYTD